MIESPPNAVAPEASLESSEAPPAPPASTPRLVLQFFLGPLLIVLVCAGIYALFGLVVFEKKSPDDFLRAIKSGSAAERWQSAFELSRWIAASEPQAKDPRFAAEIVSLFRDGKSEDPRVRRYLALALGRLGDPSAVEPLLEAVEDPDAETRLYAVWSLGALRAPAAAPRLTALLESDDPGMVKMAVYALGSIGDPASASALRPLLEDPNPEVRWNAALALARMDDASGVPVLLRMTEPEVLAQVGGLTAEQKAEAMTNAMKALHRLGDAEGMARIRVLAESAAIPEVRSAAITLAGAPR